MTCQKRIHALHPATIAFVKSLSSRCSKILSPVNILGCTQNIRHVHTVPTEVPLLNRIKLVNDTYSYILSLQEQPTEAGPFPDAPTLVGTPAAPTGISRAPNVASTRMGTPGAAGQNAIDLGVSGCDDVIPTPGFFRPGCGPAQPPIDSPATPEDAPIKPFSFSNSSGSHFATPEIPIHSGMTPVTTAADARHAQKHIPAWNRCSKLVEKSFPLVARQIKSLASMPGPQPAWAHTPYMLLHSICTTKGWELSVRHESAPRIGVDASVIATVNIPAVNDNGRTFTSTGRNQGVFWFCSHC